MKVIDSASGINRKSFLRHSWLHILIISITLIYLIFAPRIYTHVFVKQGKPVAHNVTLPPITSAVQYALDGVEPTSSQGFDILSGWAFQTGNMESLVTDYEWQVVFLNASGNYLFKTEPVARKYVQKFYSQYGLDVAMSGFSTLIYRDTIRPGVYGIGLIFTNRKDHSTQLVNLEQCLTRTPNHLHLEDLESAACRDVTNNRGQPVEKNHPIPDGKVSSEFFIEALTTLEESEIYQFSGWAFPITDQLLSSGSFERRIVLSNDHDDYFFTARTIPRFDIQAAFSDLGMDLVESGFTSIISANELEKGSYHMGLIFTHKGDGMEFFIDTNRCITRTEDGLVLVPAGTPGCHYPTP